ncbi:MAG: glycine--tRNA ligase subunit beta [Thermovirgaceae bacterium]
MTTRDYLLEIGTEEIPAGFVSWAVDEILKIAELEFADRRLRYDSMKSFATPRRIVLYVRDLAEKQEDLTEELKGPTWQQAFDANEHPTKAAKGFARSKNVSVDDLEKRNVGGTDFAVAVLKKEGASSVDVLEEVAPAVIRRLVFPKNMYWDETFVRFARPIRWILSLFGSDIVPFSYGSLEAGRATRGHRFMGSRKIEIKNTDEYFGKLFDNSVIIDPEKRREKMIAGISAIEKEIAARAEKDEVLVEENLYLVEYPVPFAGRFDESFLEMPEEVLTTTMKHHQRYFPVRDEQGALKPYFIGISNNRASNMAVVREGNERVLRARLTDAAFFWREDLQIPLHKRVDKLKSIVHHEQLGSVYDRTLNIQTIVAGLCDYNGWSDIRSLAERAAYLSKADQATAMVYEFAELRGVMGREYAKRSGEDERVALAVYEQYLPAFAGDVTPSDRVGAVLGIADRLDTIAGGFKAELQPTGSQDPYGLRRAARTINEIIWALDMDLDLENAARTAAAVYKLDDSSVVKGILDFLRQRLQHQVREKGYPHDLTALALSVAWHRPLQVLRFLGSFTAVRDAEWFRGLVTAAVRVRNILTKAPETPGEPDENLFTEDAERALWHAVEEIREPAEKAVGNCEWEELTRLLARLEPPVTAFFDDVLVMTDDEKLRQNRLSLLGRTENLFAAVGDLGLLKG